MITDHALIQQSMIMKLPEPEKWDLHYMQDYLQTTEMGSLVLLGRDATVWGSTKDRDSYKPDLVALNQRTERDAFSLWAAKKAVGRLFTHFFARFVKPSPVHGLLGIEATIVYRATYGITSMLASMIPIASIVVLYYVDSMPARLATIAAFNILISLCLMVLAGAKRAEIFAVTAAYVLFRLCGTYKLTSVALLRCR
jgi:tetrahydromethanopterin S-methyltransferase subunit E